MEHAVGIQPVQLLLVIAIVLVQLWKRYLIQQSGDGGDCRCWHGDVANVVFAASSERKLDLLGFAAAATALRFQGAEEQWAWTASCDTVCVVGR